MKNTLGKEINNVLTTTWKKSPDLNLVLHANRSTRPHVGGNRIGTVNVEAILCCFNKQRAGLHFG